MAKFQIDVDENARKAFVSGAGAGAEAEPQPQPSHSHTRHTVTQCDKEETPTRRASEMRARSFRLTQSQLDWLMAQAGERMRAGERADASSVLREILDRAMHGRHTV
ncbi:MAG TPA: hypothetical protein VK979_01655 [Guyparkeria sp.]|nr:hypothetical protein TspCOW1_21660 [Thiohalobacter sp. COW1]HSH83854.1 hypothetical protein [Guyparkeria sp.]